MIGQLQRIKTETYLGESRRWVDVGQIAADENLIWSRSGKAIYVTDVIKRGDFLPDDRGAWLPVSQVRRVEDVNPVFGDNLVVPTWLATKLGI